MVRGLIIRQSFLVLYLILFGLIVLTGGMVVMQLFEAPVVSASPNDPETLTAAPPLILALRDRKDYDSIKSNGLFGEAGRFDPEKAAAAPPPPPPPGPEVVETTLNLTLWGTTSLSAKSVYASASIEDASRKTGSQLFFVGDTVVPSVTLEEVHPRWVVLKNSLKSPPQLERLSMDEDKEAGDAPSPMASRRPSRPTAQVATRVELDKNEFIQELQVNYVDLVTKVKPELYRDSSGRVAGITAADISDVPLAKKLGLENGDVLQTVNNEKIDSEQKILEMVQKYQNVNSFRIGILRNGRVENITYNLK